MTDAEHRDNDAENLAQVIKKLRDIHPTGCATYVDRHCGECGCVEPCDHDGSCGCWLGGGDHFSAMVASTLRSLRYPPRDLKAERESTRRVIAATKELTAAIKGLRASTWLVDTDALAARVQQIGSQALEAAFVAHDSKLPMGRPKVTGFLVDKAADWIRNCEDVGLPSSYVSDAWRELCHMAGISERTADGALADARKAAAKSPFENLDLVQ